MYKSVVYVEKRNKLIMIGKEEKMKATINKFVTILLVSVVLSLLVGGSGATWCDTNYAKRINVSVNNTAGSALTDYQVYVNLSSNPINETSLRVYNSSDCTSRDFWCEETSAGNCTKLWINYSVVTASAWSNNTAIYYDNAAASSASNITSTMIFGDDFASDKTSWNNPVLDPSQGWESSLRWGSFALKDGVYYMYYSNYGSTFPVGRATSTDLVNWTKYSGNPLTCFASGDGGVAILKELDGKTPVLYNSEYWMTAHDWSGSAIKIYNASTIDNNSWSLVGTVITPQAGTWYSDQVTTNSFVKEGSTYYIFFQGLNGTTWKIGYANSSSPGGPYTVQGVLLEPSLGWEGTAVVDPALRKFGSTYYLFYTGNTSTSCYNSYATSSTLTGTYTKSDLKVTPQGVSYPQICLHNSEYHMITDDLNADDKPLFCNDVLTTAFKEYRSTDKWLEKSADASFSDGVVTVENTANHGGLRSINSINLSDWRMLEMRWKDNGGGGDNGTFHSAGFFDNVGTTSWYLQNNVMMEQYDYPANNWDIFATVSNGAWNYIDFGVSDTNWHRYKIKVKKGEIPTFWQDSAEQVHTVSAPDVTYYIWAPKAYDENNKTSYFDWIFLRKYASPEPASELGSEEQQGADTSFTVTLPSGYAHLKFEPSNSTVQNVTPNGQTDSQEFYNVTNTGDVNLDIRLKLNETVSNIVLKADTDNNPLGAKEVNTTLVTIYSNLVTSNSADIWLWSDFSHTVEQDTNKTINVNVTQSA